MQLFWNAVLALLCKLHTLNPYELLADESVAGGRVVDCRQVGQCRKSCPC